MSGGVSLAIWMGGVTTEVDRLRREYGAYGDLVDLLGQEPIVDIVSGTSAGGLNGVLLATAVANGSAADTIRRVWSDRADFKVFLDAPVVIRSTVTGREMRARVAAGPGLAHDPGVPAGVSL